MSYAPTLTLWLALGLGAVAAGGLLFMLALGVAAKQSDEHEEARKRDEAIQRRYCEQEPFDNGEDLEAPARRIRRLP